MVGRLQICPSGVIPQPALYEPYALQLSVPWSGVRLIVLTTFDIGLGSWTFLDSPVSAVLYSLQWL